MVETKVCAPEILDVGRVLDQEENVWEKGYQTFYRRRKPVLFMDKVTIDFATQAAESASFFCDPYIGVVLFIKDDRNNSNSYPLVRPEASPDNVEFFRIIEDSDLNWAWGVSALGGKKWTAQIKVYWPWMRIRIDQANPSAGRDNIVSVRAQFSG